MKTNYLWFENPITLLAADATQAEIVEKLNEIIRRLDMLTEYRIVVRSP